MTNKSIPTTKPIQPHAGQKKTRKTPAPVIAACRRRLAGYLSVRGGGKASG